MLHFQILIFVPVNNGLGFLQTPGYLAPVRSMDLPLIGQLHCRFTGGLFHLVLKEVEKGLPYDAKTDMYGLGCLGYEMASLK